MKMTKSMAILVWIVLLIFLFHSVQAQITELSIAYSVWSPNGQWIALVNQAGDRDTIEVFTADLVPVITLRIDNLQADVRGYTLNDIAWSSDSTALAAAVIASSPNPLVNSYVAVWDVNSWSMQFAEPYDAFDLTWSPSGNYLGAGGYVLDAATSLIVTQIPIYDPSSVNWAIWHPTDENQLLLGFDNQVNIFDPFTGEVLTTLPYSGLFEPNFTPDGRYLALVNRVANAGYIINIVDTTTYQQIASFQPDGSLGEPYALNWLSNDNLAVLTSDLPLMILNPFAAEIIDTVSLGSRTWNPEGTQFFYVIDLPSEIGGGRGIAVYDRVSEGVIAQYSLVSTVRSLAVMDMEGATQIPLLAGEGLINSVSVDNSANALIQAFTSPITVGSAAFDVNGVVTIDNSAPYNIALPLPGTYTISVIPYSMADGQGETGLPFIANIQVLAVEPTATITPTDTPTPVFNTVILSPTPPNPLILSEETRAWYNYTLSLSAPLAAGQSVTVRLDYYPPTPNNYAHVQTRPKRPVGQEVSWSTAQTLVFDANHTEYEVRIRARDDSTNLTGAVGRLSHRITASNVAGYAVNTVDASGMRLTGSPFNGGNDASAAADSRNVLVFTVEDND